MPKRIAICADGTWSTADQRRLTNVAKMALAILPTAPDGTSQVVFYHPGVGTGNLLDRLTGGAFGSGLDNNIEDAYRFLLDNYDSGDQIFFFGFSRGAYTVRSTVGLIRQNGLLRKIHAGKFREAYARYRSDKFPPDSPLAKAFRDQFSREVDIHFLGVWDTVGALGIPIQGLRWITQKRYKFHDVELSGIVRHAYQAVAIDERRAAFAPSLWLTKPKEGQAIEQIWFAGAHGDVGGGCDQSGLSDDCFKWMKRKAEACGLAFAEDYIDTYIHPNELGILHNSFTGFYRLTRGRTRYIGDSRFVSQAVHSTAVDRLRDDMSYRPKNLLDYLEEPYHRIAEHSHEAG